MPLKIGVNPHNKIFVLPPNWCGKGPPEQWELWEAEPLKPYHFNRTLGAQKASSKYCQCVQATRAMRAKQAVTIRLQPYFGFHCILGVKIGGFAKGSREWCLPLFSPENEIPVNAKKGRKLFKLNNPEPQKYKNNCLATNFLSDSAIFPTPN